MSIRASPQDALVPTPRERRRRSREQMTASIVDAARAVMIEHGVAGLTLREVAQRVSMRAPSLYEYFPSKLALYDAVFLAGLRLFQARVEQARENTSTFWEQIGAAFDAYMGFAREYPELYQLLFEHPIPDFVPSAETMAEGQAFLERFTSLIADAIDRGEIEPGISATEARDLLIAMMHGLTSQHLANDADAAPGAGRYGGLIEPALALFRSSWTSKRGETL